MDFIREKAVAYGEFLQKKKQQQKTQEIDFSHVEISPHTLCA